MNYTKSIIFGILSVGVGLYPIVYLTTNDRKSLGLLQSKSDTLLNHIILWNICFYQHIICGGIALVTGCSQFNINLRKKYTYIHRFLGKVYVSVCLLSSTASLYLSYYATGGLISSLGFSLLGLSWIYTTFNAYYVITRPHNKQIKLHEYWMIRSYSLTWSAVMLRIYIPLSQIAQYPFIDAYRVIAWMCWVPNLLVAEYIIHSKKK